MKRHFINSDNKKDLATRRRANPYMASKFRRMKELVGKRYHSGTNTEKKTDPLNIIEEAAKARQLMDDARTSYLKGKLKADPLFMGIVQAKMEKSQGSNSIAV
ncbi:hypothetical protein ACFE04_021666 [Oxalis oulophora]